MGILEKLASRLGYEPTGKKSKQDLAGYIFSGSKGGLWNLFNSSNEIDKKEILKAYTGWTFACVRAIAEEVAKTKFKLYTKDRKGNWTEVFEHDALTMLNRPNKQMIGWEFKYLTAVNLELFGEAYWFLDGMKDENSKPTGMYPLQNTNLSPVYGNYPELIQGYDYSVGDETKDYRPFQVLAIRYPNPKKFLGGMGVPAGIANWIDADNYATEFNKTFFKRGAVLGGYLESEHYQDSNMLDYMAKAFQEAIGGASNAHKIIAMPQGTKFTPSQSSRKDMDFSESMKDSQNKIMAGFRVPRSVLGITDDVNRANAEAADYVFASRTIKPKLQLITDFLNSFWLPLYGDNLILDFEDPTPENKDLEIREYQAALGSMPYMSVNEVREDNGLPPIENGDDVMSDFSKQPLGKPMAKSVPVNAKPQLKLYKPKNELKEATDKIAKEVVEKTFKELEKELNPVITKDTNREQMQAIWKGLVSRVAPFEKKINGNFKKINAKIFKQVRSNIDKIKSKAFNPDDLYDEDEIITASIDLNTPTFTELYKKEGLQAAKLINAGEFKFSPELKKALDKSIELLSQSYSDTTKQLLKDSLEAAITDGLSILDRIAELENYCDSSRAETVAKTESFRVANIASKESWKQNGISKIEWFTAEDELVCPFCGDMDGKTISVDENFFDKGDSLKVGDKTLDFGYADIEAGALHANCRCITKPVVDVNDL